MYGETPWLTRMVVSGGTAICMSKFTCPAMATSRHNESPAGLSRAAGLKNWGLTNPHILCGGLRSCHGDSPAHTSSTVRFTSQSSMCYMSLLRVSYKLYAYHRPSLSPQLGLLVESKAIWMIRQAHSLALRTQTTNPIFVDSCGSAHILSLIRPRPALGTVLQ